MGFWRRLLSKDYRDGRGAEAAGDLVEAARAYASAGADEALLRVTRRRAEDEADPRARVRLRRQALELAEALDEEALLVACRGELGEALATLSRAAPPGRAKELALEAGGLLGAVERHADAGRILEAAGAFAAATEAYVKAGDILAVERTAALGGVESPDPDMPTVQLAAWVGVLLDEGRVEEALQAVEEAERERRPDAGGARAALRERLPERGRLVLEGEAGRRILWSEAAGLVGREAGLALQLSVPSLSRRHLSLQRAGEALVVSNLSQHGEVTVDGQPILAPTVLQAAAEVGLAGACLLKVAPEGDGWAVQACVGELLGDVLLMATRVELGAAELAVEGGWWRCEDRVVLRGDTIGPFRVVG